MPSPSTASTPPFSKLGEAALPRRVTEVSTTAARCAAGRYLPWLAQSNALQDFVRGFRGEQVWFLLSPNSNSALAPDGRLEGLARGNSPA
ncbi:hypothetical protein M8494_15065 [Serratia ureilytica]